MYMLPQALLSSVAYEFIEFQNRFIYFLLAMLYWVLMPKPTLRRWCPVWRGTCQSLHTNEQSEREQSISNWIEIHLQLSEKWNTERFRKGTVCLQMRHLCSTTLQTRDGDSQPTTIQLVEDYAKCRPDYGLSQFMLEIWNNIENFKGFGSACLPNTHQNVLWAFTCVNM